MPPSSTSRRSGARYEPDVEPRYLDFDERLEHEYAQDRQLIKTSRVFGIIALVVACMGLLGLTAFSTQQRLKEIGVRKVLGGSTPGLVGLLNREVCGLVLAANVLAVPLGYELSNRWLESFQYRVDVGPSNR